MPGDIMLYVGKEVRFKVEGEVKRGKIIAWERDRDKVLILLVKDEEGKMHRVRLTDVLEY